LSKKEGFSLKKTLW